jgi:hypothetical protein
MRAPTANTLPVGWHNDMMDVHSLEIESGVGGACAGGVETRSSVHIAYRFE